MAQKGGTESTKSETKEQEKQSAAAQAYSPNPLLKSEREFLQLNEIRDLDKSPLLQAKREVCKDGGLKINLLYLEKGLRLVFAEKIGIPGAEEAKKESVWITDTGSSNNLNNVNGEWDDNDHLPSNFKETESWKNRGAYNTKVFGCATLATRIDAVIGGVDTKLSLYNKKFKFLPDTNPKAVNLIGLDLIDKCELNVNVPENDMYIKFPAKK